MKRMTAIEFAAFLKTDTGEQVTRQAVDKMALRHGITKGRDGKYDAAALLLARKAGKELDKSRHPSMPGTTADAYRKKKLEKLSVEVAILQTRLDEIRGELKPQSEWIAEIREIVAINRAGLEQWIEWVASEFRNPLMHKKAKELYARLCRSMQERTDNATEK